MKTLKLPFLALLATFFSFNVSATEIELDLLNPDVRKCLIEASKSEGWKLEALYENKQNKLVFIFSKGNETKTYISK